MSSAPLKTTRRMFALAARMEWHVMVKGSFIELCVMAKEYDDLCARYVGAPSDLDLFNRMAKGALGDALVNFVAEFAAIVERRLGSGHPPVSSTTDS